MKDEKKFIIRTLTATLIIAALFLVGSFILISLLIKDQTEQMNKYLYEVAVQSKNTMETQIRGDFQSLQGMAAFIGAEDKINVGYVLDILENEIKKNEFLRMGFVYPNGQSYIVDKKGERYLGVDFSDREYVQRALQGEQYISEKLEDRLAKGDINCYSVPICNNGQIIGVLCAVIEAEVLQEILETPTFGNSGFSHIVSADGDYIVRSGHSNSNTDINNMFEVEISSEYNKELVKENMKERSSGMFSYNDYRGERLATYIPLDENNWYLLSIVPKKNIDQNFNNMLAYFSFALVIITILFLILYIRVRMVENENKNKMEKLAYFDKLTGCYNKNMFIKIIESKIKNQQWDYAVVILDINNFKYVNELFGFEEGNLLLKHIVKILNENIKPDEIFSRSVADKFLLMLKFSDEKELLVRLENIMDLISQYSIRNNRSYSVISSAGVNVININDKIKDIELIIDHANVVLNKIKGRHVNSCSFYDDVLHKKEVSKKELENNMESALKNEEFVVFLQPKFLLETECIMGAEALVRWNSPTRGLVPPDSFIPLFEQNGFVIELDMYVLNKVCETLNMWKNCGYTIFPVSVNQSRMHLYEINYIEKLLKILQKNNIKPELIILEVTENVAFNNTNDLKKMLEKLREIGFSISMDDFGSGYSSLNILKELPIDELKLDRIFLQDSEDKERGDAIITKVMELSKCLNIKTVTEGVETAVQAEFLKNAGCDIAQGYYYARPMPIDDFEKLAFEQ